ncbi:HEPN domain-containing protein [Candidatus Thiosymbion oneisti]|uniref:HEPN domain-containing protein n=1 Tax=Candidatus Thiosymbion oneisti TaxID=589554 RepID=UPI000B7DC4D4|nr:HEPN domain-containing protein [Candidatus Thiosymbion oneisti]
MIYGSHFRHADDIVNHLNDIVPEITNPLLKAKYVGFVSVAAVTVYELAIKEILIEFARRKHQVFGHFIEAHLDRINGRIRLKTIKEEHISRFGSKYETRFQQGLDKRTKEYLQDNQRDIKNSYTNLIIWRNDFSHTGRINPTTTYEEAVQAYEDGKEVIHCLASCMIDE